MEELKQQNKRGRDSELESEIDTQEVKRLREDLLDCLDDDAPAEFGGVTQDLDSFMKSFEDEIAGGVVAAPMADPGESRPDLGYLLEASDDELGLPPTASSSSRNELARVEADSTDFGGEFWDMPNYDSFEFGYGGVTGDFDGVNGGEYVALDGLFDHSDLGFGLGDFNWRSTTPAQ